MSSISYIPFDHYKNFSLLNDNWGIGRSEDIIKVLENVIQHLYPVLDQSLIPNKAVVVRHGAGNPLLNRSEIVDYIYLSAHDMHWAQYSYQFSHELCHFIIDSDWFESESKFGWFEEAICEMASIFVMRAMSQTWLTTPPYPNWRDYATSLADNIETNIQAHAIDLTKPLSEWFSENISELETNRYLRSKNIYVSLKLLPIFNLNPELWSVTQYLKFIKIHDHLSFKDFLLAWKEVLPEGLSKSFKQLEDVFNT